MQGQYYELNTTLLPLAKEELDILERVHVQELTDQELLVFDQSVSDFFFAFEPQKDIELFLQNAYFADRIDERLRLCSESLQELIDAQTSKQPSDLLIYHSGLTHLQPLRHKPIAESMRKLLASKEFKGQITVCTCGEPGCGSEYAWIRDSVCIVLFTVDECLREVSLYPFRIEVRK